MTMNADGGSSTPTPVLATVVSVPTAVGDIESHHQKVAVITPVAYANDIDEDAGKGLGIAMFVLLLVGMIFNFINPAVSFVCLIATFVISSILTCGCCCAGEYRMKPNVKKFAKYTLVSLSLMVIVQLSGVIGALAAISKTGKMSSITADGAGIGIVIAVGLGAVFYIMALIFSALFTWGRGWGAQQPIGAMVV